MKTCRIQKNQKKKSRRRLIHFVIAKSTEAAIQKKSRSKDVHPTQSHNHRTTWNPRLSGKRARHEARNLRVVHTHENYNRPPRYTFSSSFHSSFLSLSLPLPLSVDEDTGKEREQTQREKKEIRGRVFKGGLLPQKSRISRCIRSELVTRSVWRVRCVAASDSKLQGTETKRRKNTWLHTGDRSCRVNVSSSPILVGNLYGPKFRERENEERGGET